MIAQLATEGSLLHKAMTTGCMTIVSAYGSTHHDVYVWHRPVSAGLTEPSSPVCRCILVLLLLVHALAVSEQDAIPCMQKRPMKNLEMLATGKVATVTGLLFDFAWMHMHAPFLREPAKHGQCPPSTNIPRCLRSIMTDKQQVVEAAAAT